MSKHCTGWACAEMCVHMVHSELTMTKGIFATLLVIVVVLGVYFGSAVLLRTVRASVAQQRGESFISKLYAEYTILGKSCQGEDTDADAYVSCDFRIVSPAQEERIVHLQCPTIWKTLIGNSCKETRLILPQ